MRKINLKKIVDHGEMFSLIDMYPELDRDEKDYIKNRIEKSEKDVMDIIRDNRRFYVR